MSGEITGAELLIKALEREGVEVIFGFPGGSSMPIHHALHNSRIRVLMPRHEQGEAFAACGYARASGKVGVCLATSGPGATNLVTGIADAKLDSIPLVAITGQVPSPVLGTDAFQETSMIGITRMITKHSYLVTDTADLPRIVKEAFYIAHSGRFGPVLIDIPKDIQVNRAPALFPESVSLPGYDPHPRLEAAAVKQAARLIREAARPVVYAGGGVVTAGASGELRQLAQGANLPVTTTLMGLGCFPQTSPLSLGMLGMHGTYAANRAVAECDLLIGLGVRFDDRVTGNPRTFSPRARIIHVDVDPSEINKNKRALLGVEADLRDFLLELAREEVRGRWEAWLEQLKRWQEEVVVSYQHPPDPQGIVPQFVIEEIDRLTPDDAIIVTGVGQHQMWAAQYYRHQQPRCFITSGGLGAMGFGLPAAIGAKVACPGRTVVDIDGDGSLLMNIQELASAKMEKVPVKIVVFNNQILGMVYQWEDRFFEGVHADTIIGNPGGEVYPDFVAIAKGFGLPARRVTRRADLESGLKEMLAADTAFLLDVVVKHDEHVLPMIPPGKTVDDIIIGKD